VAPQDGTRILLSHARPLVEKLQPSDKIRFETRKFQWLGAYDAIAQAMTLWHAAPAGTVDELKIKPLVIGSFNNTHLTYQWAMLLKTVLNANYKVITGYRSGNDLNLRWSAARSTAGPRPGKISSAPGRNGSRRSKAAGAVHARAASRAAGRAADRARPARQKDVAGSPARRWRAPWRWGRACRRTASPRCARRSTRS
jgi:hypothetical protein